MSYVTEAKLANTFDIGINLPVTEIRQGDWVIIATTKIVSPMKLQYRYVNISLVSSNVDVSLITSFNKVWGNLDLAYLALRRDYASGDPGESGALDTVRVSALGLTERGGATLEFTTPGTYSWILANNMQPSEETGVLIPSSTSIDFVLSVSGQARIFLDSL